MDNATTTTNDTPAPATRAAAPSPAPIAPLVPGTYLARAVEMAFGYSSTGTPQVGVVLEITEGPSTGAQIVWYGYFSEGAAPMCFRALKALGWDGKGEIDDVEPCILANPKVAKIVLKEDTWDGVTRLKVDRVSDPAKVDGVAMKDKIRPGDGRLSEFAADVSGALKLFQQTSGTAGKPSIGSPGLKVGRKAAPAEAPAEGDDEGDDDIPF